MSEEKTETLVELGSSLEEHFYAPERAAFIEQRQIHEEIGDRGEELRSLGMVMDESAIARMVELHIRPSTWAAIFLIPLIEVGWADNKLDRKERNVVMQTAEANGLVTGSLTHRVLDAWFQKRPDGTLFQIWTDYIGELSRAMNPRERDGLCNELLARSHDVGQASGGFFGIGEKLSSEEQAVIHRLWKSFKV